MRSGRSDDQRVVIIGMGAVGSHGTTLDALWEALNGPSGDPSTPGLAAFDPARWMSRKQVRRSALYTQLAVAAATEAWQHAGRPAVRSDDDDHGLDPRRCGVVMAAAYGALEVYDEAVASREKDGPTAVSPILGAVLCENAPAAATSLRLGLRGPTTGVVAACAGGSVAVADGATLLRAGRCDLVVAGGTQAPMGPVLEAAYDNLRVRSPSGRSRPFDRRRDGFTFAYGAASLVLERLDVARAHAAAPLAELLGFAATNDAFDVARPEGNGALECMQLALDDAGVAASEIVAIDAHGTATRLNDEVEAQAIRTVFGADGPPVTSNKGMIGHYSSAAGAYEAIASVLSLQHGRLPPTSLDFEPDPTLDIDVVNGEPRTIDRGPILSNSFGLGGVNCSLVLAPV